MNQSITILLFVVLFVLWLPLENIAGHDRALAEESVTLEDHIQRGKAAYQRGVFGKAAFHWMEAARLSEAGGNQEKHIEVLVQLADALQQIGEPHQAIIALEHARNLVNETAFPIHMARILGQLGNVYFHLGETRHGLEHLNQALQLARGQQDSVQAAVVLNDLGNALVAANQLALASSAYAESALIANATGNPTLATVATINLAHNEINEGVPDDARERLDVVSMDIQTIADTHDKVKSFLKIGLAYADLYNKLHPSERETARDSMNSVIDQTNPGARGPGSRGIEVRPQSQPLPVPPSHDPSASKRHIPEMPEQIPSESLPPSQQPSESTHPLLFKSARAFRLGADLANRLGDPRMESYGWGYLGHVYEQESRWEKALAVSHMAVATAQKVQAPESLYRWHWQTGRIHRALNHTDEALTSFRHAMYAFQPIHAELLFGPQGKQHSFRQKIGPLFYEFADLLLQEARRTSDPISAQEFLLEARNTIEVFKAAELQDYFQDECVAAAKAHSTPLESISKTTAVIYPILLTDRMELLLGLQHGLKQFIVPIHAAAIAKTIYDFRKAVENPASHAYRPLAQQLYNWLLTPLEPDLQASNIDTLVFVPDGPLRTIPVAALHDGTQFLIEKFALATTPGLTLTDASPLDRKHIRLLALGLTQEAHGFPSLPYVATELEAVRASYPGKVLLNSDFRVPNVERALKDELFNVVHIASHGQVEPDVNKTFILAFDKKITMSKLAELIGIYKFREIPLDLLTLSACQTAIGDDRAALGLAGIAIKAGARSALASLWFIEDEATSKLVPEFYRQLKQNPALSKAHALRNAQLSLIKNPRFHHPSFWGPFLLINNWL